MLVFMDAEFTGLQKDTQLISIGFVAEDGNELYLEFNDIDMETQDQWIKDNVLNNTAYYGNVPVNDIVDEVNYYVGDKQELLGVVLNWFKQYDDVLIVADVGHYDMVLFLDLFGGAFNLPKNICASYHDINQDIADFEHITEQEAFNTSREDFISNYNITVLGNKHNSLYDAKVCKEIYNIIHE